MSKAKINSIVNGIKKITSIDLMPYEEDFISSILEIHEVEPSASAERISKFLNETGVFQVTHEQIYNLL